MQWAVSSVITMINNNLFTVSDPSTRSKSLNTEKPSVLTTRAEAIDQDAILGTTGQATRFIKI